MSSDPGLTALAWRRLLRRVYITLPRSKPHVGLPRPILNSVARGTPPHALACPRPHPPHPTHSPLHPSALQAGGMRRVENRIYRSEGSPSERSDQDYYGINMVSQGQIRIWSGREEKQVQAQKDLDVYVL